MKSAKLIVIVFLLSLGNVFFAANDHTAAKNTYDKYKVIYERNMFSKNRIPPQKRPLDTKQVQSTTVLSIYVLRGTAAESGRAHKFAFIEEQISGESEMAKVGTTILGGQIKEIHMNYVLFEEDGKTRKVRIGEEFGKTSSTVMKDITESAEGDAANGKDSSVKEKTDESSTTDESDLLKKLMERRKRELGT